MDKQTPKSAFTFVELLVVIAIIGILAALLLPTLHSGKEQARRVKCSSGLRQIGLSARLYVLDNGQFPWHLLPSQGGTYGPAAGSAWMNFSALSNYLDSPQFLHCPSDREAVGTSLTWGDFAYPWHQSNAVSYFVGLDSYEQVSTSFIAGDRNILGGVSDRCSSVASTPGVRAREFLPGNPSVGWGEKIHNFQGAIALNDGSVQRTRKGELQDLTASTYRALVSEARTVTGRRASNHILPPRTP